MRTKSSVLATAVLSMSLFGCIDVPGDSTETVQSGERSDDSTMEPDDSIHSDVRVPRELVLDKTNSATCAAVRVGFNANGCIVVLTCHDQSQGCRPSFCTNGGCGNARERAQLLCRNGCNNADCSLGNLVATGGC